MPRTIRMMTSTFAASRVVIALALLAPGTGAQASARALDDCRRRRRRRQRPRRSGAPTSASSAIASCRSAAAHRSAATLSSTAQAWSSRRASSTSTTTRPSELTDDPAAETQVAQGITTLVVGPDGGSPWPIGDYLAERRRNPAAVNVAAFAGHATVRRLVMGDDFKRPARRRRGRADGDARRSGDARRRDRPVERSRVRGRRLRRDERARRAVEGGRAVRRHLHVAHPRRGGQELRGAARGDRDWRARAASPSRSRTSSSARSACGTRRPRRSRSSRRRRTRGVDVTADEYPVQRVELDDHGAGPRQAVRLSAERREGARRCRRGGERPDRPPRGAPGVRVQDARRGRERPQDDAGRAVHPDRQGRRRRRRLHLDGGR